MTIYLLKAWKKNVDKVLPELERGQKTAYKTGRKTLSGMRIYYMNINTNTGGISENKTIKRLFPATASNYVLYIQHIYPLYIHVCLLNSLFIICVQIKTSNVKSCVYRGTLYIHNI